MPFKIKLKKSRHYNVTSKSLFVISVHHLLGKHVSFVGNQYIHQSSSLSLSLAPAVWRTSWKASDNIYLDVARVMMKFAFIFVIIQRRQCHIFTKWKMNMISTTDAKRSVFVQTKFRCTSYCFNWIQFPLQFLNRRAFSAPFLFFVSNKSALSARFRKANIFVFILILRFHSFSLHLIFYEFFFCRAARNSFYWFVRSYYFRTSFCSAFTLYAPWNFIFFGRDLIDRFIV